jgi:hypothetical protein
LIGESVGLKTRLTSYVAGQKRTAALAMWTQRVEATADFRE